MTGNLRAVIAASRAATPRLLPRPVSRFESPGPVLPESEPATAESREHPEPMPTVPTPADTGPTAQPIARTLNVAPRPDDAHATIRATPRDTVAPPVIARAAADSALSLHARQPIVAPASPNASPPPPRRAAPHLAPLMPQPTVTVASAPPSPARVEPVRTDPAARAASSPPPRLGALVAAPTPVPLPPTLQPQSSRRRADPLASTASGAPVPDIHVSIGRIEVRATPATGGTTADGEKAARSPVIGLDEYLAQRGTR